MTRLATDLPGALSQRKVMVETLTYIAREPGRYRYLDHANVATGDEAVGPARGLQIIRTTEEGWAGQGNLTIEVRLLTGTAMQPHQIPVAILFDSPDDVQDFLEQYAPEVFEAEQQWSVDRHREAMGWNDEDGRDA